MRILIDVPAGRIQKDVIDALQNLELHRRIHARFAGGATWDDIDSFVGWIYAELFAAEISRR